MDIVRTRNRIEPPAVGAPRAPTAAEHAFDALLRWWRRRETEVALMRCSDRVLADLGIGRDDIPLVARGLDPASATTPRPRSAPPVAGLVHRMVAVRGVERPRQHGPMTCGGDELDGLASAAPSSRR